MYSISVNVSGRIASVAIRRLIDLMNAIQREGILCLTTLSLPTTLTILCAVLWREASFWCWACLVAGR